MPRISCMWRLFLDECKQFENNMIIEVDDNEEKIVSLKSIVMGIVV